MAKAAASRVTLSHPSGKFEVNVSARRAVVLEGRGYTRADSTKTDSVGGLSTRNALVARAKELGIPAKGNNTELAAAIEDAERE